MLATRWWRFLLAVAACVCTAAFDVEGGAPRPPQVPGQSLPLAGRGTPPQQLGVRSTVGGQVAGAAAKISGWYRAYQNFVAGAAKVNQLISFCCGVWLVMSTPLTFLGASVSIKFTEAAMVLFLGLYGLLMMGVEVPLSAVQTMLRQYFFFVYTRLGRMIFVFNVALVAWSVSNVGFITKALMTFNAGLTVYILNSQDRRFAQVDAEAKAALQQAAEEMRGQATNALSFTQMFSGAFGGFGGGSGRSRPAPMGGGVAATPSAGFDSNPDEPTASGPTGWPSGGGGSGGV